ncbi:DUF1493 family protein [Paraburkholderia bannensis]|uniref:DUF1493 family protein n=1 Tax=Paraburkholderia bannensis TaxID=765414 RepID=UPI002AC358F1|nr:DUF1493 family protein [Paraburkholderia bannensis]
MDDALWKALTDYTREEIGRPLFGKELTLEPTTEVIDDLRIDGDDAVEFIDKLFLKFDVKGDFPYARYFSGEGTALVPLMLVPALVGALFRAVTKRPRTPDPDDHPLTLGMLHEAMRKGRWDTDEVERSQQQRS